MALEATVEVEVTCPKCGYTFTETVDVEIEPDEYP